MSLSNSKKMLTIKRNGLDKPYQVKLDYKKRKVQEFMQTIEEKTWDYENRTVVFIKGIWENANKTWTLPFTSMLRLFYWLGEHKISFQIQDKETDDKPIKFLWNRGFVSVELSKTEFFYQQFYEACLTQSKKLKRGNDFDTFPYDEFHDLCYVLDELAGVGYEAKRIRSERN